MCIIYIMHNGFRVVLITTPLLMSTINMYHCTLLTLCHVQVVNSMFLLCAYCTHLILILRFLGFLY